MAANPFIGVMYHWIGGLAAASFYIPYKAVRKWSWETYWLVGGFFSWIIAPICLAWLLVPNVWHVLGEADGRTLLLAYGFGVLWGIGGLTFGLSMRYLGIALGMAVALGFCAAFGTLMPPIFQGQIGAIFASASGRFTLLGVLVCLVGIAISGMAGMSKEREMSDEQKKASIAEFNFGKGILVASFAGVMSSCMAFGLAGGAPIATLAKAQLLAHHDSPLWQNLPILVVVLLGGFTTNFIWCVALNLSHGSAGEYINAPGGDNNGGLGRDATRAANFHDSMAEISATEAVSPWDTDALKSPAGVPTGAGPAAAAAELPDLAQIRAPLLNNYTFSALAGVIWYLQFFFYSMGETEMGKYKFASWTLHMASIIIFSTLWGVALKEWTGTSKRTHWLIAAGLAVLIGSTVVIGYGSYLQAAANTHKAAAAGRAHVSRRDLRSRLYVGATGHRGRCAIGIGRANHVSSVSVNRAVSSVG